jgi:hypothetical protein
LQALEIIIRNAFHRELASVYGPAWYDSARVPLTPAARARLASAKETLRRANRPLDPGRIVAELSFGFWERLLTRGPRGKLNYEMALWRPALHRAFPNSRRLRADVHKSLPGLRDLRNRIAHHEPIFSRDLEAEYQTILDVIGWMCIDTRAWVMHHSGVSAGSRRPALNQQREAARSLPSSGRPRADADLALRSRNGRLLKRREN